MITVIGYASLISEDSARKTIPNLINFRMGTIKGYKRIFNKVGVAFFKSYEIDNTDLCISSCSTREQHDIEIKVSIFQCKDYDFLLLYNREHRFKWIEVEYTDCNGRQGTARMCTEYNDIDYFLNKCVLNNEYEQRVGQYYSGKIWRDDILPFPVYLNHCINAASKHGNEMLDNFLTTSYLADNVTSIKHFLAEHQGYLNRSYSLTNDKKSDYVDYK